MKNLKVVLTSKLTKRCNNLVQDWRLYVILMSISAWIVRRVTYQAWLGAGWPQWVLADQSIEEQNEESLLAVLSNFQTEK